MNRPQIKKEAPVYHRLTIDLEPDLYRKLKAQAERHERTASKEAKVIIKASLPK